VPPILMTADPSACLASFPVSISITRPSDNSIFLLMMFISASFDPPSPMEVVFFAYFIYHLPVICSRSFILQTRVANIFVSKCLWPQNQTT